MWRKKHFLQYAFTNGLWDQHDTIEYNVSIPRFCNGSSRRISKELSDFRRIRWLHSNCRKIGAIIQLELKEKNQTDLYCLQITCFGCAVRCTENDNIAEANNGFFNVSLFLFFYRCMPLISGSFMWSSSVFFKAAEYLEWSGRDPIPDLFMIYPPSLLTYRSFRVPGHYVMLQAFVWITIFLLQVAIQVLPPADG